MLDQNDDKNNNQPPFDPSLFPPRKFKRKLTPFLCRELLYEYANGLLDREREEAVREFLDQDKDCRDELAQIQSGQKYAENLSQIQIADELLHRLKQHESIAGFFVRRVDWSHWPVRVRQTAAAFVSLAAIAVILLLVPWKQFNRQPETQHGPLVLADVPNGKGQKIVLAPGPLGSNATDPTADPTQAASEDPNEIETNDASNDEELGHHEEHDDHHHHAETPAPPAKVAAKTESAKPVVDVEDVDETKAGADESSAAAEANSDEEAPKATAAKGFVYRAFMDLENIDELTPQIVQQIIDLGGEKAGEVELGWRRGTGSYFHFSLPESNEKKILEILQGYGPVRISKDPHPRVMPTGKVRFILWIERKQSAN